MSCCGGSSPTRIEIQDNRQNGIYINNSSDKNNFGSYNISRRSDKIVFKCVIVGPSGVGKSTLFKILSGINISGTETVTTMAEFATLDLDSDVMGKKISISLTDTAGQERFQALTSNFMNNAAIVVAVFSFEDINGTYEQLMKYLDMRVRCPKSILIVYCNKSDLSNANLEDTRNLFESIERRVSRNNIYILKSCSFKNEKDVGFVADIENAMKKFIFSFNNQPK